MFHYLGRSVTVNLHFRLVDALRDFGQTDWQLSSMICQTLWNYSEKITSAVSCFGEKETEDLMQILQDYTGECDVLSIVHKTWNFFIIFIS